MTSTSQTHNVIKSGQVKMGLTNNDSIEMSFSYEIPPKTIHSTHPVYKTIPNLQSEID